MSSNAKDWTFRILVVLMTLGTLIGGVLAISSTINDRTDTKIKCATERLIMQMDESQKDRAKIKESLARIEEKLSALTGQFEYIQKSRCKNDK